MYAPPVFRWDNRLAALQLARDWNFALLITQSDEIPFVTHLPFLVDEKRNVLRGHVARANSHGGHLDGRKHLAVFSGPNAYISPDWFGDASADVPTWNYVAVHIAGRERVLTDESDIDRLLADLSAHEEHRRPDFENGGKIWTMDKVPAVKHARLHRAIVAFEIDIEHVEAKAKLSQNKPPEIAAGLADVLSASNDETRAALARLMRAFNANR